jgi:hypothetical protein
MIASAFRIALRVLFVEKILEMGLIGSGRLDERLMGRLPLRRDLCGRLGPDAK